MWRKSSKSDSVRSWRIDPSTDPPRVDYFSIVLNSIQRVYQLDTTMRVLPFHEVRERTCAILRKKLGQKVLHADVMELLSRNHTLLAQMVVNNPIVRVADKVIRQVLFKYTRARRTEPPTFLYVMQGYCHDTVGRFERKCRADPSVRGRAEAHTVVLKISRTTHEFTFPDITLWAAFLANKSLWTCCTNHPEFEAVEVGFKRQAAYSNNKFRAFKHGKQ